MTPLDLEASSNGRTADFGSVYEGSNPSASAHAGPPANLRAELRAHRRPARVLLVALGDVRRRLLHDVGRTLADALGLASASGPSLERPQYAFNEARRQYHASAILRRLAALRAGAAGAPVLGIADVDLFVPDAPWVLGDADRAAGAAVVSVARLADGDLQRRDLRARVEAVHEAGHLLGLDHCPEPGCAMHLSTEPGEVDRKAPALCRACRAALGP